MNILIFILIIALLVLVHEAGHFFVARWSGMKVEEFGFGFPPRVWKIGTWKGTLFSVNAIPLGGFVKIEGENGEEKQDESIPASPTAFSSRPRYLQALVLIAGVTMNILFAWLLIFIGLAWIGMPMMQGSAPENTVFKNSDVTIVHVLADSPAESLQLKSGDIVESITYNETSYSVIRPEDVTTYFETIRQESLDAVLHVQRQDESVDIVLNKELFADNEKIGIALDLVGIARITHIPTAFSESISMTVDTTKAVFWGILGFFKGLVTSPAASLDGVSGPVGIVKSVGDASVLGFGYLVWFTALISINLAVINILPIPALDGGRLLVVGIESIIRRPLPAKAVGWVNAGGFLFLIGLMIVVTFNDIIKLF
jgi:regulator of sigma E protease